MTITVSGIEAAFFKKFITSKPFEFAPGMRCLLYSGKEVGNLGFMTALMGRDEDYFVVPIMNSGFYLGAETGALLRKNGKFAGVAFVGYSAGVYPHSNHRYLLRDGSCIEGKVLVAQKDKELIDQNKNKPMLIVDDLIATGETTAKVEEMLRKDHGVKEIYKVVNDYSCLYL